MPRVVLLAPTCSDTPTAQSPRLWSRCLSKVGACGEGESSKRSVFALVHWRLPTFEAFYKASSAIVQSQARTSDASQPPDSQQIDERLLEAVRRVIARDLPLCLVPAPHQTENASAPNQRRWKWRAARWDCAEIQCPGHNTFAAGTALEIGQAMVLLTPPSRAEPPSIRTDLAWYVYLVTCLYRSPH
jgi:hypothetical protein